MRRHGCRQSSGGTARNDVAKELSSRRVPDPAATVPWDEELVESGRIRLLETLGEGSLTKEGVLERVPPTVPPSGVVALTAASRSPLSTCAR